MRRIDFGPGEPGTTLRDLEPLLEMVGDARVIGLGEFSAGSHEVHRLKHRIVELLAANVPIAAVAFEASLPEVIRVNEYVLEGRGDPVELLPHYFPADLCTAEMADFLRWLWGHNAPGRRRIALAGCEVRRIDTAAAIAVEQVRSIDAKLAESVEERYDRILEADRIRWLTGSGVQAWFPVEEARGRRLRFSGYIRTEGVSNHACIWAWAGAPGSVNAHDALEGRRPRGTTTWRGYAVEIDVPPDAVHVSLGCYLAGTGKAWFDGLSLTLDGKTWRDPERIDLDLSSSFLRGLWVDPRSHAALDAVVTRTRRRTLRIEPAGPVPEQEAKDVGAQAIATAVLAELEAHLPPDRGAKALQCARVVVQALEMRTGGGEASHARSMAENVEWLLGHMPDARVVFWSQNDHVARRGGQAGAFLARRLGARYLSVGFATARGLQLVGSPKRREGPRAHALAAPPPESVEARLLAAGHPRSILDLRTIEEGDREFAFLKERRRFRSAGIPGLTMEFGEQRVSADFDLLVWLEETRAARPLPRRR